MKQEYFGLKTGDDYRKLATAFKSVVDKISTSYGKKGMKTAFTNSMRQHHNIRPFVTNDGFTILNQIVFTDRLENFASKLLLDCANQVNTLVGDGTTTAIVLSGNLAYNYFNHIANILNEGKVINYTEIYDKFLKEENLILKYLNQARKQPSSKEVRDIAFISSRNEEVADIIFEIFERTGKDSYKTISYSGGKEIETNIFEDSCLFESTIFGLEFYNEPQNLVSKITDCYLIATSKIINSLEEVQGIYKKAVENNAKNIVILSVGFDEDKVIPYLKDIIKKTDITIYPIAINLMDEKAKIVLEEIALLNNAAFADNTKGKGILNYNFSDYGLCDEIYFDNKKCIIKNSKRNKEYAASRLSQIEVLEARAFNQGIDMVFLKLRKRNLQGSIAEIKVGANTNTELLDLETRIEDALRCCQSACDVGIIEGGGVILNDISYLEKDNLSSYVAEALREPRKLIVGSASVNLSGNYEEKRYDINTGKLVDDLIKVGVIDSYLSAEISIKATFSLIGKSLYNLSAVVSDYEV